TVAYADDGYAELCHYFSLGVFPASGGVVLTTAGGSSFVFDELVKPFDFTLDPLKAVALQFSGVGVGALARALHAVRYLFETLGQAGAATLKDAQPRNRVGALEHREAHVKSVVVPGRGPGRR